MLLFFVGRAKRDKGKTLPENIGDVSKCELISGADGSFQKKASWRRQNSVYAIGAATSLLTLSIYLFSLQNDFVSWDDGMYVTENPHIRSFNFAFIKWAFLNFHASNWHPLTWLSHAMDYAVWGLNPMGHHLTNNILHAANTFVVVLLTARLIEALYSKQYAVNGIQPSGSQVVELSGNDSTTQQLNFSPSRFTPHDSRSVVDDSRFTIHDSRFMLIAAGVTGLLFGIHPVHVESVAWVAERKDLLCALFYLLSVMAYMSYATDVQQGAKHIEHKANNIFFAYTRRAMLLALCFFTLALMSKPMAVSLPAVLLILDWHPFGRINSLKTFTVALIEKIPFIALSIISSALTLSAQKAGGAMHLMAAIPLHARAMVATRSLAAYLGKIILPIHLIPFYPYPKNASFFSLEFFAALVLVTGITAAGMLAAKKQKIWLAVWGFYVVTLFPVLGIVQAGSQSMADRYMYLPACGPFLLIGFAFAMFYKKCLRLNNSGRAVRIVAAAAFISLFTSLTYLTVAQIRIWKNDLSLWEYQIRKQPADAHMVYHDDLVLVNLGAALLAEGRVDEAMEKFQSALKMNPYRLQTYINMGIALGGKGRLDEAIEYLQYAVRIDPSDAEAHNNLGWAYSEKGMIDEAIIQFETALQLSPDYSEARSRLEAALKKKAGS